MKAYVYGSEVQILDFYLARLHNTPYCLVRYKDNHWIGKVPTSCIEIRRTGAEPLLI